MQLGQTLELEYRRVSLGIRAPRVAILVQPSTPWAECLRLVETLSAVWGGPTFALIPSNGDTVDALFWRLLKEHDPDWLMYYAPTTKLSDKLTKQLLRRHSTATPWGNTIWPFWPGNAGYPLTDVWSIVNPEERSAGPPLQNIRVEGGDILSLAFSSSLGFLDKEAVKKIEDLGITVSQRLVNLADRSAGIHDIAADAWEPFDSAPSTYPFSLSSDHLGLFAGPGRLDLSPLTVVCGDTVADFAFFWTLRSLRGHRCCLPSIGCRFPGHRETAIMRRGESGCRRSVDQLDGEQAAFTETNRYDVNLSLTSRASVVCRCDSAGKDRVQPWWRGDVDKGCSPGRSCFLSSICRRVLGT